MKILVTGANGFLGSNLVKYFIKNTSWNVYCMVNKNIDKLPNNCNIIYHNLLNPINIKYKFDIVIHIAACPSSKTCIQEPAQGLNNIIQTFNILEFCRLNHINKFVFFSSCEVYGIGGDEIDETHSLNPLNMYAASKVSGESMCFAYHKSYKINFILLRIVNVWGDDSQSDRFYSILKRKFKVEKCPEIIAKTKDRKRWLHINDMCKKTTDLLHKEFPKYEIFNLVGDDNLLPIEFISKFGDIFTIRYELDELDGYCNNCNANGTKLTSYLL